MLKIKSILILLLGMLSVFTINSYSWNALGHMVVAEIAYEQLNPEVKKKVDKMVTDLGKEYPYITSFYQLGPWPDLLKIQKIDIYSHWHYTDLAFSKDGTALKNLENTDNVIWAINQMEPIVANNKANIYERAKFLAFLVHVIADIHQPLHTTSLISAKLPDGDKGGNLYYIKFPASHPKTIHLHKLWDQGIDVFVGETTFDKVTSLSHQITALYPKEFFGAKVMDLKPEHWADEGLQTSITMVYSTPENQVPSDDYLNSGRLIVQQQAALAGYRLAAVLNQLLN
jgi:hypothetical protein